MGDEANSKSGDTALDVMASALVDAKAAVDVAKAALKTAEDAYSAQEAAMAVALRQAGESLVKVDDRYISLKETRRWSMGKEHKDALQALLKTHAPELVKESVHTSTLNKYAGEMAARSDPPAWWGEVQSLLEEKVSAEVRVTKGKPKSAAKVG